MKDILKEKRRLFDIIVYDDIFCDVIFYVKKLNLCRYYHMYHTLDKYDYDGDNHKKGDLKKPHHHILLYYDNPRTLSSVAKYFKLEPNMINIYDKGDSKGRLDYRVKYLVHYKSKNEYKFEYDIDSIDTNDNEYKKFFNETTDKTKSDLCLLFDFFDSHELISYRTFLNYVYEQDLWSTFRQNAYIFNKLFEEHNKEIKDVSILIR